MKIKCLLLLFLTTWPAMGQPQTEGPEKILSEIEKNNTTLAALRQKVVTEQKANEMSKALPDPRVGFSNSWGNQPNSVNKQNFSVEQELDWGTVSGLRNKTIKANKSVVEFDYLIERQKILAEADQYLIELIYYNALYEEYAQRVQRAEDLKDLYAKKLKIGDANQLEVNKVKLNAVSNRAEFKKIAVRKEDILNELKRLNGNIPVVCELKQNNCQVLPMLSDLMKQIETTSPILQKSKQQIEAGKKELQLNKLEGLPNLSIGYVGEIARGDNTNGFSIGMNIPIWGNSRRKINYQKTVVTLAEMEKKDMELQITATIQKQYAAANHLTQIAKEFRQELSQNEDLSLLDKALNQGQISLIDYINEITFYYTAREQALEAERDSQLAISVLKNMLR